MLQIGAVIVLLGLLVFVHELGHFLVARRSGEGPPFSIGFGPKLLGFTKGDTEYWIAALPLGGYVRWPARCPVRTLRPRTRRAATSPSRPGSGCSSS
jgi:regulator of sigma E protease